MENNLSLTVSPSAVTSLLTLGLVPMPDSIFSEIKILGIGDHVEFSRKGDGWVLSHHTVFPYFNKLSRQDVRPDPQRLLDLLAGAVERGVAGRRPAALMLSSGKDSTALALALARLGYRDVSCLTFATGKDNDEDTYARSLCDKLGLPHERVAIRPDSDTSENLLTNFFCRSPLPCADDCQIPYATSLQKAGNTAVLDGSGNDVYMGHVPTLNDRRRAILRVRNRRLANTLEVLVPYGTRMDQLLRDPVEHCFMQGMFRFRDVRRFFPNARVARETIKKPLMEAYRSLNVFDFRALVRGRHYDQGSSALKAYNACAAIGAASVMPWCDREVIEFCFHMPRASRFNEKKYINKVCLREMLCREVDYPDDAIGKRYFSFDRAPFFLAHRKYVFDEILGCRHWQRREAEKMLSDAYRRLPRNPRVGVALNAWFLVSGWLNHNRWMRE